MDTTPDDARDALEAVEFGLALRRAQHLLGQRIDDALSPLDLNLGLWRVLNEMADHPGASGSELARASSHTPQTLGGLLQRLQDRGLIDRSIGRGRIVENHLTTVGSEVLADAKRRVAGVVTSTMTALNSQQRECLKQTVIDYASALAGHPRR